jgi:hypothetical protein
MFDLIFLFYVKQRILKIKEVLQKSDEKQKSGILVSFQNKVFLGNAQSYKNRAVAKEKQKKTAPKPTSSYEM